MFQKIFQKIGISVFLFIAPTVSFAQSGTQCGAHGGNCFGEVDTLFTNVGGFIDNILIPLVFTFALFLFMWGMFRFFIFGAHSEDDRSKGRQLILWGIIGMVFMVSIWGIVNIFAEGLFGASNISPKLPGTPTL